MSSLSKAGQMTLLMTACLTIMVGAAIAPALANVSKALDVEAVASWLITLPSLGAVLFAPIAGRLIDKLGGYRALNMGLLLYGLLGVLGIFCHGITLVIIDRVLLGGAVALTMAGGTTLISQWYQGESRLKMMALQGMSIELGGVLFLFFSGQLALLDWRLPFFLYLFAWICWLMLVFCVPKKAPTPQVQDQQMTTAPTHNYSLSRIYLAALLSMVIFFTVIVTLPISLKHIGYGEGQIGALMAFISIIAVITASQMPKVIRAIGAWQTLILSLFIYGCSHGVFYFNQSQFLPLIIAAILTGIAFGLSIPLVNHMTVEASSPQVRGRNLSYLTMAIFLGQFLTSFFDFIPLDKSQLFGLVALMALVFACLFLIDYRLHRHTALIRS